MVFIGGLNDQYVYVMNGQCVSALSSCVTDAQSKQVVATRECLDYALEHDDVNCCEVKNSCSTSRYPNILILDNDSALHGGQNKRQSFHERVGMIKKYSMYIGSGGLGSTPMSSSSSHPSSGISPTAAAAAKAAVDLADAVAAEQRSLDEEDDLDQVVMLKKKSNGINISSESIPTITPSSSAKPVSEKKANGISFSLEKEDSMENSTKGGNGVNYSLEKSNTRRMSVDSETSVSGKSPGFSEPSPATQLSYRKYNNGDPSNPTSRIYSNPQSSIYNFEKQFSERAAGFDAEDDGVYQMSFVENIAMFVPVVILAAACSGTMDTLGELRQVTTVFIELKSYDPVKHSDPRCLQPFFMMAQQCLHESGGFLRQFLVDDKGCVLIAMWGTPSFTYSNNSCRALHFAVSVNQKALQLGHSCSAGVTTGTVFCGTVGAVERCDYAGVGTDVNMAARLMCKAEGGVLVDRLTYQSFNQDMKRLLTEQYPMTLKGSAEPVTPYKYTSSSIPPTRAVDDIGGKTVFLKRKVMTLISEMLDRQSTKSLNNSSGNLTAAREFTRESTPTVKGKIEVLVVTGATGTGKTVASQYFRHASQKLGVQVIELKANSTLSVVPYGIIKELILELLPIGRGVYVPGEDSFIGQLVLDCYPCENLAFRDYVTKQLESLLGLSDESGSRNHELLNRLSNSHSESSVSLLLEERSTTSFALTDPSGKEDSTMPNMSTIIYQVLVTVLGTSPCSLIIENYHFCDELSWQEMVQIISHKDQALTMCMLLTVRTAPVDLRSFSFDDIPTSRSASTSPNSNRHTMHYNFKGLSQLKSPSLSSANLQKSTTSTSGSAPSSGKLRRPRSFLKMDDDEESQKVIDAATNSMEESFRELLKLSG